MAKSERINDPMTLNELINAALMAKFQYGGDKYVLLSTDEEGNGYHECYFGFGGGNEIDDCVLAPTDLNLNECVILG